MSVIETGCSRPLRELVLPLAACMSRPICERNALLLSVGLNAAFSEFGLIQAWCNATVRALA